MALKLWNPVAAPMAIDFLEYCDFTGPDGAPRGVFCELWSIEFHENQPERTLGAPSEPDKFK